MPDATIQHKPYFQWISCQKEVESKSIMHVDFSGPQGGMGSCDRKAAQIKSHVKSYVNEGHSVTNVRELKQAIE